MGIFGDLTSTSTPSKANISTFQQTINKDIQSTFTNSVQKSSQAVVNTQSLRLKNINSSGNITVGKINFKQFVQVKFEDISTDNVRNESATKITETLLNNLENETTPQQQAQLAATIKASTGLKNIGVVKKPNDNTKHVLNQHHTMNVDVKNYVTNVVEKHTTQLNVQSCSQFVKNNQAIQVEDIEAQGDVTIDLIKMEQVVDAVLKCKAVNKASKGIVDELVKNMGAKPKPPPPVIRPVAAVISEEDLKIKAEQAAAEERRRKAKEAEEEMQRIIDAELKRSNRMKKIGGIIFLIVCLIVVLVIMYKLFASNGGNSQKGGFLKIKNVNPMIIIAIIFLILKKNSLINK